MPELGFLYVILINLVGLVAMGVDKARAKHNAWRIPEKTLLSIAVLGGAFGIWIGMQAFRHKTRHWYFKYGVPVIFVVELFFLAFLRAK